MDGEAPSPPLTVRVCDSLACALMGSEQLLQTLKNGLEPGVRVVRAPGMGGCHNAPVTAIGHALHEHATIESVAAAVASGATHPLLPDYIAFGAYRAAGGYRLLGECLSGKRDVESVIKALEESGLRGLRGAGFPTWRKLRFLLQEKGPRLMAINADAGEPGTVNDHH